MQRIIVRGRVQGVYFRKFVEDAAEQHNLEGWVRNRRDGAVEAVFSGADDDIAAVIDACRRGPPRAHVEGIEMLPASADDLKLRPAGVRFSQIDTL